MPTTAENNKRIAKNTLILYGRMLFMLFLSLFTARIVFNALGVIDYGIYNVVGGFVAMFSLVSSSLSAAISRFITVELGRGDPKRLNEVFSASVTIQMVLSVIIIILIETVGVWFLNTHMNIPAERMNAANWVLQLSIISFVVGLISVPYNACIIAHEKMSAFAYMTILDAVNRLLIVFLISHNPFDRLVFYALMVVIIGVVMRLIYGIYCKRHFEECNYHFRWDTQLLKDMFGFAGWNFIGCASGLFRGQGCNVLLNLFFGPVINAARGISDRISGVIGGFAGNFMMALNPQITKNYASGNHEYMMTLIFQGARFSFYLLFFLSLPVLLNTHYIIMLWLKSVPEHTVAFAQLAMTYTMIEALSNPLITVSNATGKIRNYQCVVGGTQLLILPISYVILRMGGIPEVTLIVTVCMSHVCLVLRLLMLRSMIHISARKYLHKVYLNVMGVALLSSVLPLIVKQYCEENFVSFVGLSLLSVVCAGATIYFVGCNKQERAFAMRQVQKLRKRFFKR